VRIGRFRLVHPYSCSNASTAPISVQPLCERARYRKWRRPGGRAGVRFGVGVYALGGDSSDDSGSESGGEEEEKVVWRECWRGRKK
jgi:hypothetical protein